MPDSFLLINATDFLLINGSGDRLIIGSGDQDVGGGNGGRLFKDRWKPPPSDDDEVMAVLRKVMDHY
jgi:hypothetical protein